VGAEGGGALDGRRERRQRVDAELPAGVAGGVPAGDNRPAQSRLAQHGVEHSPERGAEAGVGRLRREAKGR